MDQFRDEIMSKAKEWNLIQHPEFRNAINLLTKDALEEFTRNLELISSNDNVRQEMENAIRNVLKNHLIQNEKELIDLVQNYVSIIRNRKSMQNHNKQIKISEILNKNSNVGNDCEGMRKSDNGRNIPTALKLNSKFVSKKYSENDVFLSKSKLQEERNDITSHPYESSESASTSVETVIKVSSMDNSEYQKKERGSLKCEENSENRSNFYNNADESSWRSDNLEKFPKQQSCSKDNEANDSNHEQKQSVKFKKKSLFKFKNCDKTVKSKLNKNLNSSVSEKTISRNEDEFIYSPKISHSENYITKTKIKKSSSVSKFIKGLFKKSKRRGKKFREIGTIHTNDNEMAPFVNNEQSEITQNSNEESGINTMSTEVIPLSNERINSICNKCVNDFSTSNDILYECPLHIALFNDEILNNRLLNYHDYTSESDSILENVEDTIIIILPLFKEQLPVTVLQNYKYGIDLKLRESIEIYLESSLECSTNALTRVTYNSSSLILHTMHNINPESVPEHLSLVSFDVVMPSSIAISSTNILWSSLVKQDNKEFSINKDKHRAKSEKETKLFNWSDDSPDLCVKSKGAKEESSCKPLKSSKFTLKNVNPETKKGVNFTSKSIYEEIVARRPHRYCGKPGIDLSLSIEELEFLKARPGENRIKVETKSNRLYQNLNNREIRIMPKISVIEDPINEEDKLLKIAQLRWPPYLIPRDEIIPFNKYK
ncbi:putative leucine-rich repeat-containing protein DDB_G0290503 [Centruroides vittatus]|uniref:putative leucine-rich repeat-containing protein DDB_G0290503 n=1 Tax=Centruroides vittatus TaxID=120091 RepID=UPI00350F29E6